MPIYEYRCSGCGHINEVWQKFSDQPLDKCEVCGGSVKKIISHNTFQENKVAKKEHKKTAKKEESKKEPVKDSAKEASD